VVRVLHGVRSFLPCGRTLNKMNKYEKNKE